MTLKEAEVLMVLDGRQISKYSLDYTICTFAQCSGNGVFPIFIESDYTCWIGKACKGCMSKYSLPNSGFRTTILEEHDS